MQTSGNSSSLITRVAGVAAAFVLAIALTGNWLACSPGEPNCDKVECGGSGSGGGGGDGGTGGIVPAKVDEVPAACGDNATGTGDAALKSFETKFIAVKCGQAKCHNAGSVFYPKGIDDPSMIRTLLVGQNAKSFCKTDKYINKTDPDKSYVLAKISAMGDYLNCPTPEAKSDAGGTRMPNKEGMPGALGDRLPDGDIECFTWYINNVVKVVK